MPKHLTIDGCHAVCGPAVGELAEDGNSRTILSCRPAR